MLPITQSFSTLTGPTKELEKMILAGTLDHGNNEILRWNASNVAVIQNSEGEIRPTKKKSPEKIDGVLGTIFALDRVIRRVDESSIYDERGFIAL